MKKLILTAIIFTFCLPVFAQIYTVERVIDGDTIKLTNGERVRLIGIDTPESKRNNKAKKDSERTGKDLEVITEMGKDATAFVKLGLDAVNNKVKLEYDVQQRDKYGRLLAYVYVYECADCVNENEIPNFVKKYDDGYYFFLNALIIRQGYATPMTIPPNVKYADLFQELYKEARGNKRGLWGE